MHSTSVTSYIVIYGKEAENRRVLSLVLNDQRHFDDFTSDGRLFQVLAVAMGNTQFSGNTDCNYYYNYYYYYYRPDTVKE